MQGARRTIPTTVVVISEEIVDFQTQCLIQQGYSRLTKAELESIKWGLRFTPTVCMLGSIYGLLTLNPYLLFGLAAIGIIPFWFPDKHPLDLVYNHVIAPVLGASRLPANPLPRRIACVSGGALNIIAALFVLNGHAVAAYVTGGMLFILQLVVNTTHFCLASFLIESALKVAGKSLPTELIDGATARELTRNGGVLIDVRDPSEFELGALPGARNFPLGALSQYVDELKSLEAPLILYCEKGGRARMAHGLLSQRGVYGLNTLGGIERWQS